MDPTTAGIVVALIGAAAGIIATVIQTIGKRKATEKTQKIETAVLKAGDRISASGAPYRIKRFEKITEFKDTGEGTFTKTWTGVTTDQSFDNLRIPFRSRFECHGAKILQPVVEELAVSSLSVKLEGVSSAELTEVGETIMEGKIVVIGHFSKDTGPVSFYLRQPFVKGFCLTRKEAIEAYKDADWKQEYGAMPVAVPIEELIIVVHFPPSHSEMTISPSPVVFIAGTETVHAERTEHTHQRQQFQFINRVATLTIRNPVIGLSYAISWMPPAAKKTKTISSREARKGSVND